MWEQVPQRLMKNSTEILVIGGGPAGATAASLLAKEGFEVTLLEKAQHPRYHIGESLLPSTKYVLEVMGALPLVERCGFVRKEGALLDWGGKEWAFGFSVLSGHGSNYSFQVPRAEFDQLLFQHARSLGVDAYERVEISGLDFSSNRPTSATWRDLRSGTEGTIGFSFLVDASGRSGVLSTRYLRNRRTHSIFQNIALWGYWTGARQPDQLGKAFCPPGAIATCAIPDGWLWGIPLHDGTLSVGLVLHREALKAQMAQQESQYSQGRDAALRQIYLESIAKSPIISALVAEAECLTAPLKMESDYSYVADSFAGPGYLLCGDAACFLDPLLSTGVHLAMFSALLGAASIASSKRGEVSEAEAQYFYQTAYRHAYLRLLTLVSAFYQNHSGAEYFRQAQQLTSRDYREPDLAEAFVSIVSGMEDVQDVQSPEGGAERIIGQLAALQEQQDRFLRRQQEQPGAISEQELEGAVQRAKTLDALRSGFSLTPESAIGGLYVQTEPRLGLAQLHGPVS
jgi:flavin-dependent dehydrogenase